jgi:hypothetical protein
MLTNQKRLKPFLILTTLLITACSSGIGATGSYLATSGGIPSAGLKTRTMVNLALVDGPNDFAFGLDTELMERLDEPKTKIGQWRIATLFGYSNMPRPNESLLGGEMLLNIGMARMVTDEDAKLKFLLGGQIGIPIRLFSSKPAWRSDDFISLGTYLVPYLGVNWLAVEDVDFVGGISLRLHLWSSTLP